MVSKKALVVLAAVLILFGIVAYGDVSRRYATETVGPSDTIRQLIAGQHTIVGDVGLTWTQERLEVHYTTDSGWRIKEIHFGWFEDTPSGHPNPGGMQYKFEGLDTDDYAFTIPRPLASPEPSYFAAHAVVENCESGAKGYATSDLPEYVKANVFLGGNRAKFRVELESDGILNGNGYNGWCADESAEARPGYEYDGIVITDWTQLEGIVANPDGMRYVEWIVKQNMVGREMACGEIIQRHHVQNAIWHFIDNKDRDKLGCVAKDIIRRAYTEVNFGKNVEEDCWEINGVFVVAPIYKVVCPPGEDYCVSDPEFDLQPIIVDMIGTVDCPPPEDPTPTPTPRNPTRTPTPTQTPPPCPTCPPGPTCTPTPNNPTPTPTPNDPTTTPTPTQSDCSSETAWAYGEVEFSNAWGWFIYYPVN